MDAWGLPDVDRRLAKSLREAAARAEGECPARRNARFPKEAAARADPKEPGQDEAKPDWEPLEWAAAELPRGGQAPPSPRAQC